jgi:hypothetical protein
MRGPLLAIIEKHFYFFFLFTTLRAVYEEIWCALMEEIHLFLCEYLGTVKVS